MFDGNKSFPPAISTHAMEKVSLASVALKVLETKVNCSRFPRTSRLTSVYKYVKLFVDRVRVEAS